MALLLRVALLFGLAGLALLLINDPGRRESAGRLVGVGLDQAASALAAALASRQVASAPMMSVPPSAPGLATPPVSLPAGTPAGLDAALQTALRDLAAQAPAGAPAPRAPPTPATSVPAPGCPPGLAILHDPEFRRTASDPAFWGFLLRRVERARAATSPRDVGR